MSKRRDSRSDSTNLQVPISGGHDHSLSASRRSSFFSQSDIPVTDGFQPVNPRSRSSSPRPQPIIIDQNTATSSPLASPSSLLSRGNRNSTHKAPVAAGGADIDGNDYDVSPTEQGNSSSIPGSSSITSPDADANYQTRIRRISFSYPRMHKNPNNNLRPAHPYALYQQSTIATAESHDPVVLETPAAGFPGRSTRYERRLGPDGEEMAAVGPDGHTEELPPYTRYPTSGPIPTPSDAPSNTRAVPVVAGAVIGAAVAAHTSSAHASQAGTPLEPQSADAFAATRTGAVVEPSDSPFADPVSASDASDVVRPTTAPSQAATRSTSSSIADMKEVQEKSRQNKKKRLLFGAVPMWVVLVIILVVIILAVVAGAVLGKVLNQQHNNKKDTKTSKIPTTSVWPKFDASSIPTPTGLPPLPQGVFFFPLGAAGEQERRCINSTRTQTAWTCTVANQLMLIDFDGDPNWPQANIFPAPPPPHAAGIAYGPQPPIIRDPQRLQWVEDRVDPGRGPALHFGTSYDKLVVIEGEKFPLPDLRPRDAQKPDMFRGDYDGPPPSMTFDPHRNRLATDPGEEPWFCYFNSTFIEGFVYVKQAVTGASTQAFAMPQPNTETTEYTEFTAMPTATDDRQPSASSSRVSSLPPPPTPTSDRGPPPWGRFGPGGPKGSGPPQRFPFIVKMAERRLPTPGFKPFCKRMHVFPDGHMESKKDAAGNDIVEQIAEAERGTDQPPGPPPPGSLPGGQQPPGLGRMSERQRRAVLALAPPIGGAARDVGVGLRARAADGDGFDDSRRSHSHVGFSRKASQGDGNACHCQWVSPGFG